MQHTYLKNSYPDCKVYIHTLSFSEIEYTKYSIYKIKQFISRRTGLANNNHEKEFFIKD